jgi:hypothetical protein
VLLLLLYRGHCVLTDALDLPIMDSFYPVRMMKFGSETLEHSVMQSVLQEGGSLNEQCVCVRACVRACVERKKIFLNGISCLEVV